MSYNISHIETPLLDAWIYAADVVRLLRNHRYLPSNNLLRDLSDAAMESCGNGDAHAKLPIKRFSWSGEGSGHDYRDTLLPQVVPHIHGTIEAIIFWVGGDEVTGLLIQDGMFAECTVEMRIIRPENWT